MHQQEWPWFGVTRFYRTWLRGVLSGVEMEPQIGIMVALPVLSLLCEAPFYLCFVLLLNNGRAVNRSCLALWFPRGDRKAWPPPSPCFCPCQGSGVQQEMSWVR